MQPELHTRGLDFAQLSLCDALDLAILVEEEARERYTEFADQLELHHTPQAAEFFRHMARIEAMHKTFLLERRNAAFGIRPVRVNLGMLFDIEAPAYDEARAFMSVREALNVVLRSEEHAQAFFAAAKAGVQDQAIRALFSELEMEEIVHQRLVREEMARQAPESPGNPEDYSDPPVQQ